MGKQRAAARSSPPTHTPPRPQVCALARARTSKGLRLGEAAEISGPDRGCFWGQMAQEPLWVSGCCRGPGGAGAGGGGALLALIASWKCSLILGCEWGKPESSERGAAPRPPQERRTFGALTPRANTCSYLPQRPISCGLPQGQWRNTSPALAPVGTSSCRHGSAWLVSRSPQVTALSPGRVELSWLAWKLGPRGGQCGTWGGG